MAVGAFIDNLIYIAIFKNEIIITVDCSRYAGDVPCLGYYTAIEDKQACKWAVLVRSQENDRPILLRICDRVHHEGAHQFSVAHLSQAYIYNKRYLERPS